MVTYYVLYNWFGGIARAKRKQIIEISDMIDDVVGVLKLMKVDVSAINITELLEMQLRQFFDDACRRECKLVTFIVEQLGKALFAAQMMKRPHVFAHDSAGPKDPQGYVSYFVFVFHRWGLTGSASQPHQRQPDLQFQRMSKCIEVILVVRGVSQRNAHLPPHYMWVPKDGQKGWNRIAFLSVWQTEMIFLDRKQLEARLVDLRGVKHPIVERRYHVIASTPVIPF